MEKQEFLGQLEASGVQVRQALDRFMGNEELFLSFLAKLPGRMGFEEMLQALEAGPDHGGAAGDPHYHRRQRKGCAVQRGAWGGGLPGEAGGPPHGAGAGMRGGAGGLAAQDHHPGLFPGGRDAPSGQ